APTSPVFPYTTLFRSAVSGGFIEVLQPLAESLSIDFARANELEIVAGKLTGEVRGQIVSPEVKAEMLRGWAAHTKIPIGRTVARSEEHTSELQSRFDL